MVAVQTIPDGLRKGRKKPFTGGYVFGIFRGPEPPE
jgi:hypothetical protein